MSPKRKEINRKTRVISYPSSLAISLLFRLDQHSILMKLITLLIFQQLQLLLKDNPGNRDKQCYDGPFKILLLIFPMQTVDKLFTNSTNRTPLLPQPLFRIPSRLACPNIYLSAGEKEQVLCLLAAKKILESQIRQGQKEQQKMMDLFESILKTQRGQSKPSRKLQRRCNKDILERQYYCKFDNCTKAYSSPTCLQRHAKLKHNSGKTQPPQPYNQLPPNPNLTLEDSHIQT